MPYSDFTNGSDSHTRGWGVKEGIFSYGPRIPKKPPDQESLKKLQPTTLNPPRILKKAPAGHSQSSHVLI